MSPDDAEKLLTLIASLDPRWSSSGDEKLTKARPAAWAAVLSDVPLDFATGVARRHYSQAEAALLNPGVVRSQWKRTEARTDAAEGRTAPSVGVPAPESLMDYMKAVTAAVAAGRSALSVPRPTKVKVLSRANDLRSRRCRYWQSCACDHARCRDGWLDETGYRMNAQGLSYEEVTACPHCKDAAVMAVEFAHQPRHHRGRGR